MEKTLAGLTANGILVIHAGWVVFLATGFLLVRGRPWGERAHLSALTVTLMLDLSGTPCPLTVAEIALRMRCDPAIVYRGSCIPHYLGSVFPQVPWSSVQLGGEILLVVIALGWYGGLAQSLHPGSATRGA
jgi:hypothetical protein